MKVLVYLEHSDVRGGIEVFADRHVARLRAEGHEVEVLGEWGTGVLDTFDEIIVHKCSDVATLELFSPEKTVYYVHDHEPICPRSYAYTPLGNNCTRSGGFFPCIFCAPLSRAWKAALVRVLSQGRRKRAMARFRKIVVISEFMKSRLLANGLPPEKVEVEPPVIGKYERGDCCASVADGDVGTESHCAIDLLYVGQLVRGKGVQLLLAAMAEMKTRRTLDIVGAGNMEPKLRALAESLGIADRVRFNGFQRNPQDWMRRAACVVVPSFWQEPYGLVATEAVMLGRPVVAFAVGGLPEACMGKATLVPPGDVAALATALDNQFHESRRLPVED